MSPITLAEMKSIRLMKRSDRKYVTDKETLLRLLEDAKDDYYVQETGGKRISPYATTYWDDKNNSMFRHHQAGKLPRKKIRVRTYTATGNSFLEVKQKDNHGKTRKKRIAVTSEKAVLEGREGEDFLTERTGLSFYDLHPTLSNRFNRITLVNRAKTERLTIDFDLVFHNRHSERSHRMENAVIIELKRDELVASPVIPLLRKYRVKPLGFSKYCIGAMLTDPSLPINRFKKRLIKIRKAID